jgi:hypothetical protein
MCDTKQFLLCLASPQLKQKQKHALIKTLQRKHLDEIGDLVEHILGKDIPLPESELKRLRRNKVYLYSLLKGNKLSCKAKKEVLAKKGGFLANQILKFSP